MLQAAIKHQHMLSALRRKGTPLEDALLALREAGATPITSISAVKHVENVSLNEAKRIIVQSDTWKDFGEAQEQLWDELEKLAEKDDDL